MSSNTNTEILNFFVKILNFIFDVGFVLMPTIGYIHQYIKIRRIKSSYGFSKMISFILLLSAIFRIFFWVGKRFEVVILLQCIAIVIMQLVLLQKCVEFTENYKNQTNSDYFSWKEFWDWPYYEDYFFFIMFIIIFTSLLSILIGYDNSTYVEFLGAISAIVEAFLGVPQVLENFRTKNVKTLSYILLIFWALGDFIKFLFYLKSNSPIQLIITVSVQFSVDMVIIGQVFYYTKIYKSGLIYDKVTENMNRIEKI
jgi:uncharacterized protein with PQ loop repeat